MIHETMIIEVSPGLAVKRSHNDPLFKVAVEDRQLAGLVAHVATMTRRLANATKAEAAQGQTTINQKVAAKMLKILLGMCNKLNVTKENSG